MSLSYGSSPRESSDPSSAGDNSTVCTSSLPTMEKDCDDKVSDICDSVNAIRLKPPGSIAQNDSDEEFHSASEGEMDDDGDDDDRKIEEWAESISDITSDTNISVTPDLSSSDGNLETSPSSEIKEKRVESLSNPISNVHTEPSPETSPSAHNEDLPISETVSPQKTSHQVLSSKNENCDNGSAKCVDKTEAEVDEILNAAMGGNDGDGDGNNGDGSTDNQEEEGAEKGDNDEDKDCDPKDKKKEEDELERKRQEEEDVLTEDELQKRLAEAVKVKVRGNDTFKSGQYAEALELYTEGLDICPLKYVQQRSVMLSNRAACRIKKEDYERAISDCTKSIDLNPAYIKAYFRRADAYEKLEKLDEALKDHRQVVEMDRSQTGSIHACLRLEKEIEERNEKMKAEMLGKLKDLGNMVLRPFGLSTNNFQMQQDPNTGSYSMQFVQNAPTNGR